MKTIFERALSTRRIAVYGATVAVLVVFSFVGMDIASKLSNIGENVPIALQPMPSLSPTPKTAAVDQNSTDEVRRFLEQYEGGDCFFVMPIAIGTGTAIVEGFGASIAPFEILDSSFKKTLGFDASIGVRLVTPPQCPAITFLNKVRGEASMSPRISLEFVKLKPGEALTGNVENFANRVVELLLVTNHGMVQNMSYLLRPGTDTLSFSIEIRSADDSSGSDVPELVMAVTTPRVLDSLRQPRSPADQFFLQVLYEAQRANLTINASARYFTIQR
jgi:serine/threonine-protein kinase